MLKILTDIIKSLDIINGTLSVMTESQLDDFARNIPEDKISCNVFGIGGYDRNESGVLRKQVRICLLKQMPVNFDLGDVDLAEVEMTGLLFQIRDNLDNSPFLNIEDATDVTPELLKYDRTILLTYFDVKVFGNAKACNDMAYVPEYLKVLFEETLEARDEAEAAALEASQDRDYLETELFHYISDDATSVKIGIGTQVLVSESTEGYPSIIIQLSVA